MRQSLQHATGLKFEISIVWLFSKEPYLNLQHVFLNLRCWSLLHTFIEHVGEPVHHSHFHTNDKDE